MLRHLRLLFTSWHRPSSHAYGLHHAARPGPEMRTALEARLGAYPAQARLNRHTARATLPAAAAAVLAAEPAMAAPAVAAFYERDVQDMAAAARQRRFPPEVANASAISSWACLACAAHVHAKVRDPRVCA